MGYLLTDSQSSYIMVANPLHVLIHKSVWIGGKEKGHIIYQGRDAL